MDLKSSRNLLIQRMSDEGWLDDRWEDVLTIKNRPPRRYYVLTGLGRKELAAVLRDARQDARFGSLIALHQASTV